MPLTSSPSFLFLLFLLLFLILLVSLGNAGLPPPTLESSPWPSIAAEEDEEDLKKTINKHPSETPLKSAVNFLSSSSFSSTYSSVSSSSSSSSSEGVKSQPESERETYQSPLESLSGTPSIEGQIRVTTFVGSKSYVEEGYLELLVPEPPVAFSSLPPPSSSPPPLSLPPSLSSSSPPPSSTISSSPSPYSPTSLIYSSPHSVPLSKGKQKKVSSGNGDALSPPFLGHRENVLPSKTQLSFITGDGWASPNDTSSSSSSSSSLSSFPWESSHKNSRSPKTSMESLRGDDGIDKQIRRGAVERRLVLQKRKELKYRMSTPLISRREIHLLRDPGVNSSSSPSSSSSSSSRNRNLGIMRSDGVSKIWLTRANIDKGTTAEKDRFDLVSNAATEKNWRENNEPKEENEEKLEEGKENEVPQVRENDSLGKENVASPARTNEFTARPTTPDANLHERNPLYNRLVDGKNEHLGNFTSGRSDASLHLGGEAGEASDYDSLGYEKLVVGNDSENLVEVDGKEGDRERINKAPTKSQTRVARGAYFTSGEISYEPVLHEQSPLAHAITDVDHSIPYVRHGREKLPFLTRKTLGKTKRNFDDSLPENFSLIFTKNFPKIISNYHSRIVKPHQVSKPRSLSQLKDTDEVAMHSRSGKKTAKALNSHIPHPSVHVHGGSSHNRERLHNKTPQQRHARSRNRSKRKVTAVEVWSLAGNSALLPCDLSVRSPQDSVQMVMWLKEGSHTPLFSVDYREQAGGHPQVWRDNSSSTACRAHLHLAGVNVGMEECTQLNHGHGYGKGYSISGRDYSDYSVMRGSDSYENKHKDAESQGADSNGGLILRDVELEDSAIYRCRVDFLMTPTRNARVNLTVVVPPSSVDIAWHLGKERKTNVIDEVGPFREGDSPTLMCYTRDAWPPPRVIWLEEDEMLDDSYKVDAENEAVINSLTLNDLTRNHHGRRYVCIAENSNLTKPIASAVVVKMALDVLGVRMDDAGVLSAGQKAEIQCTVWGSHPTTVISWTLGDKPLKEANSWNHGNRSVSMIMLTPEPEYDGVTLKCAAHNPVLTAEPSRVHHLPSHYDMRILDVNYQPQVDVKIGGPLDATNIKEGDDLYFECSAISKPPPHKVTWSHNGEQLASGNGVLVSNMTLVLQKVARANAGTYMCHATNTEGTASSPPLPLDVKYAPVCASTIASQHSVAKHENARISCNVLANPPVVEFSWAFNNTAEAVSVPQDRYVVEGTESVVNYTPVTELDYGTLLCWASNGIGHQVHPCVFQIIAAGKPDPPHNCRAFDVTISSLQVSCLPGDDGGLGQTFVLQVLEVNGDYEPVVEVRRESPSFSVANLRPATSYRLRITASNAKGESRPAELRAYTEALNHPQHETPAEPTRGRETGAEVAVGVLVGAILACLPVAIIVVVIGIRTCIRVRAARRRRSHSEDSEKDGHEIEGALTDRPLINKTGRPGSVGGVSGETGTDITTITGGPGLAPTIGSTSSPSQPHHGTQVPASDNSGVMYQGGRIYSQDHAAHELGVQVITGSSSKLQPRTYVPIEGKCQGENELLEITLPPPAAYDQGYQSAPPQMYQQVAQCYPTPEQGSPRLMTAQGYQHVFQDFQTGVQACRLPATASGYPAATSLKSGPGSTNQLSTVNSGQDYHYPKVDFQDNAHKVSTSVSFATLPLHSKDVNQDGKPDGKMSTVYNPLALFPSSPSYQPKCAGAVTGEQQRSSYTTGSLKRPIKPSGQDVQRIRENPRNRSSSLSSDRSKRESSV